MLGDRVTVRAGKNGEPPVVGGLGPLGCALAYRPDPAAFLLRMVEEAGPVFTLRLPGLPMTVVADPALLGVFHRAEESRLSARAAQADLGFEITLGEANVRAGTDLHHRLLTTDLRAWRGDLFDAQWRATSDAIEREWAPFADGKLDALVFARRVSIRVTLAILVDPTLLDAHSGFLERYFAFQDRIEEATAKAVAVPRFLGEPFVLGPVRREREALAAWIAPHLGRSPTLAPYLRALRERLGEDPGGARLATIVVGLLFAAHKNPAIGAGQALLMLLEHPLHLARVRREIEEVRRIARPHEAPMPHLDRCIKETLRLTQHSIGAVRRVVGGAFELGAYRLPEGRYVAASHAALGRSPRAWDRPNEFDPDRFDETHANHRATPYAYIPFSSGVHACPGQRVALSFIRAFVSEALLRAPDLTLDGEAPPLCYERATLAQRKGDARVRRAEALS